MANTPIIIGNWKMHGTRDSVRALLHDLIAHLPDQPYAHYAVCAPTIHLADVQQQLTGSQITWGAQDLSPYLIGAHTGDIAAEMLCDYGCRYVIVGHSERRTQHSESNTLVARKYAAAQQAGLIPILCVGETTEQRAAGETQAVITAQLDAVLQHSGVQSLANSVLAYEPVWAIGTGNTATPEQAQTVHHNIRQQIATHNPAVAQQLSILYGGSMQPRNATDLLAQPDINGGLIGGASLQAETFLAIGDHA
ncbi:MAG: triose-phosphate isomerase [Pseudomonadota bacterium]